MEKTTLAKDEKGNLTRLRDQLMEEIEEAYMGLQVSFEQLRRRHYHKVGELLIQLRMTFEKGGRGDREFTAYCEKHGPNIKKAARCEYMEYRRKLGPVTSSSREDDLPPLRKITSPHSHRRDTNRPADQYRRIVDDEVGEPDRFEIPRTKKEVESDLILDLAEKIINAGFKTLAVKLHPDKDGGSNEAMRRLNAAKKLLEDALFREELRR
jgi:hypothetical protein